MHLWYHVLLVECPMLGWRLPLKKVWCKLILHGWYWQVVVFQSPYLIRKYGNRAIIILNFKKELYLILNIWRSISYLFVHVREAEFVILIIYAPVFTNLTHLIWVRKLNEQFLMLHIRSFFVLNGVILLFIELCGPSWSLIILYYYSISIIWMTPYLLLQLLKCHSVIYLALRNAIRQLSHLLNHVDHTLLRLRYFWSEAELRN